ncbi:MAG: LPP20 family lipoprotein [Selenomonadaceae bacterium]|nr:LPP20 family lipoprotein [Selenomonadaceae bacterium]
MRASKFFSIALAAIFILFLTAENLFAAPALDWSKQVITVTGTGFASEGTVNPTRAKFLAKRAAMNEAYRQLAEVVNGVKVTGETTVSEMTLVSDIIRTRVEAIIKGAKIISEREIEDGGYEVTVQMPLFGKSSALAGVVLQKPEKKEPFPEPVPDVLPTIPRYTSSTPIQQRIDIVIKAPQNSTVTITKNPQISRYSSAVEFAPMSNNFSLTQLDLPSPYMPQINLPTPSLPQVQVTSVQPIEQPVEEKVSEDISNVESVGEYTGLIVDCREMNLQPVMSPTIQNETGDTIYGDKNLDYDKIIEFGMVSYMEGVDEDIAARAGKNPLVVKAVELKKFSSAPVLTDADSNRVLIENKANAFLENLKVVFIM